MNRIGVVVVTYNSAGAIGRCLRSLPPGLDVAVVDNASADRTCEEVRQHAGVRLIANPWNRGFAAAANQGIGALETEYALLLNPDIEIVEGLDRLADDCDQTGAAAAGARLVGSDGRPQTGFFIRRFPTAAALAFEVLGLNRLWPGNRANRRYRCLDFDGNLPTDVEQPPGRCS